MSHELRTPLNAVLGFSQLMVRDRSLTATQQEHLNIINRSGEHLLKLINDVLEMSKIEAGRVYLEADRINLHLMLGNLDDMFRLRAEMKGIKLTISPAEDIPQFVITDESKLRQVLINLVGNAIKFTERGTVILRVSAAKKAEGRGQSIEGRGVGEIEEDREGTVSPSSSSLSHHLQEPVPNLTPYTLLFEVEDTGAGIALNELAKLFKPFEQTRTGLKSSEGTGLGLAISQKFVQLMGGAITVTSKLGEGSRFCFDIEVEGIDEATHPTYHTITQKIIGLAPGQPTYRILMAEDNPTNRILLSKMLSVDGFELQEASNGEEAIALWKQWKPHLIFMDMRMPVVNGLEATQQIKADPQGKDTIIIALTASAFEEQRQSFFSVGCNDFIRKPFQYQELFTKISHHLGVQYLYEDSNCSDEVIQTDGDQVSPQSPAVDLNRDIARMSDEWRMQLRHAALAGNDLQILELLDEISDETVALKAAIADFAENFQFDQIIEMIKRSEME